MSDSIGTAPNSEDEWVAEDAPAADDVGAALTREQLFDLVWQEPRKTLAGRFGISDVALGKQCRRLHIPQPWRGYWRVKETGHPVRKPKLPEWSTKWGAIVPVFRMGRQATKAAEAAAEPRPESVERQSLFEEHPDNRIAVSDLLDEPHRLIRRARSVLRGDRTDGMGRMAPREWPCLAINVAKPSVDRALRICDALLKALHARGMTVATTEQHPFLTTVHVLGEDVSFRVEEKVRQVKPPPYKGRPELEFLHPSFEYQPSGLLTLRMLNLPYGYQGRQSWSDGKVQRVEGCLNEFVVGLVEAAEALRQDHIEQARLARERLEDEHQRQIEAEREARENDRRKELARELEVWRLAGEVRTYLEALKSAAAGSGATDASGNRLGRWIKWIEAYLQVLDPLQNLDTIPANPSGWYANELDLEDW